MHLCNAYTLSLASKDPKLAADLNRGSLNVADGKPVVWIARYLGYKHMTRCVYGPQIADRSNLTFVAIGAPEWLFRLAIEPRHSHQARIRAMINGLRPVAA